VIVSTPGGVAVGFVAAAVGVVVGVASAVAVELAWGEVCTAGLVAIGEFCEVANGGRAQATPNTKAATIATAQLLNTTFVPAGLEPRGALLKDISVGGPSRFV